MTKMADLLGELTIIHSERRDFIDALIDFKAYWDFALANNPGSADALVEVHLDNISRLALQYAISKVKTKRVIISALKKTTAKKLAAQIRSLGYEVFSYPERLSVSSPEENLIPLLNFLSASPLFFTVKVEHGEENATKNNGGK